MADQHGASDGNAPRKKAEREQVVLVPSSYDREAARVTAARTRALFAQLTAGDELASAAIAAPPRKRLP